MQGVVAVRGQTSPPEATCSNASPTPYWKYSTLFGGGRCDSWAEARFARPSETSKSALAQAKHAAFLRCAGVAARAPGFEFEAGSTFVIVTGLTVPESFV